MAINQITLSAGSTTVYANDPPKDFIGLINYVDSFTGASRPGIGEFLLIRSDYDNLVSVAGDGALVTVTMNSPSQGVNLTLPMLLAGAQTISGSVSGYSQASVSSNPLTYIVGSPNDMVKVILRDQRYTLLNSITTAYNVQLPNFPCSGGSCTSGAPLFYSETLNSGSQWTWDEVASNLSVIGSLSTYLTIPTSTSNPTLPDPTWKPRNLIFDGIPFARIVDNIAARMYFVTGYDPVANVISWNLPGVMTSGNQTLFNQVLGFDESSPNSYLNAGNVGERNLGALPSHYDVVFRTSGPFDLFSLSRIYTKTISVNSSGSSSITQPVSMGDYIAVLSTSSTPDNQTELDTVATDIAARAFQYQTQPIYQIELVGLWNFITDGAIRGIRWISDGNGARTILRFNNDRDFSPSDDWVRASEQISNQLVIGLGSTNASVTPSGTRNIWMNAGGNSLFPVSLTYSSGSTGSSTTTPACTYRVQLYGTSTYIDGGSALPVTWARPIEYGVVTPASNGMAFYSNGTLVLATCDEVWKVGACS